MHGKPNTALRLPAALFTQLATIRWLPVHFFLPVLCGYIPRIGLDILLVLFLIAPLAAQEKQTTYQFQNISFLSLNAAEEYMRHNTWYGGQPAPSANWIQYLKRQQVSPGAGRSYLEYGFRRAPYKEVPGFLAYMSDVAPDCGDCPIYDAFGKDFCTANIYHFCRSDGPIIDTVLQNSSRSQCQATVISYPSYAPILDTPSGVPFVFQFPYDPIRATGYIQYKGDLTYTSYFAGCSLPGTWVVSIYPYTSAYCPMGYTTIYRTNDGYDCWNGLVTKIYEIGAITAEPTMACGHGNPCHPTTGNKSLTENDFASATLSFTRSYHSMTPYDDYASLGRGWTHNYAQRILDYPGQSVSAKKLMDGKGNIEHFECTDSPVCSVYRSVSEAGRVLMPITGGWLYRTPDGEQRTFDAEGKLDTIEQLAGHYVFLTIRYNANDKVAAVTDQLGRGLSFNYNADGLLDSLELPSGDFIHFGYVDPNPAAGGPVERQNLVTVMRQDGSERHYHYEDRNPDGGSRHAFLLTGITDELGKRFATYAYDERARVILSEHAGGAGAVTLNYTHRPGDGLYWSITEVTSPLGEVMTYDMDASPFRKLKSIADTRGVVSVSYDPDTTWQTSKTDREGNVTRYKYDSLHEIQRIEAMGTPAERVIETDWNNSLNRIAERREPGKTTSYTYNTRGQVLTRTETDTATLASRTWTTTYFEVPSLAPLIGQIETVDGPRTDISDTTTYEYYTSDDPAGAYLTGDLKAVVNALGQRTVYVQYDGNGRPLEIRDVNNVPTVLTYHPRGWISSRTTDGKTTSFDHDGAGNLARVTQPDGSFIAYEYDDAHRLAAMEDGFGNRIEYTLDAGGNRISERTYDDRGVLRRRLSRVYDQLNRLAALLDGKNNSTWYSYDNNGNRTGVLDANMNSTSFGYDALNRLVKTVDPLLGESTMAYNARDELVRVADTLSGITQYTYDGLGNRIRLDSPDSGLTSYEYDTAGNRTAATDARGVRTKYSYDALNRLTDVIYPDSTLNVSFTYDAGSNGKGRLTRMEDAVGAVNYSYDARGNLLGEIRLIDAVTYATEYAYNDADQLTRITYPSGMQVDYTLDATGRITALDQSADGVTHSLVSNVRYEPFGPVLSFSYGNGLAYKAMLDQDYELNQLQSGNGLNWVFGRDAAGNILAIDDQSGTQNDQTFSYDALYRLDTAVGDYGSENFDYDANGNRTRTRYRDGFAEDFYSYAPQTNRLTMQSGWTFIRDASGNRTAKLDAGGVGQLYGYGDHNRLTQISVTDRSGDMVVGDYRYDGRGRRVSKTVAGMTTHFIYGPSGELLGEYFQGAAVNWSEFVYLNGQPVAVKTTKTETLSSIPKEVIMDNDESGTSSSGKWHLKTSDEDYQANYRQGAKADTYRWTPQAISGTFEIHAWWVSNKKNSKMANYRISHDGSTDDVVMSQNTNGGQWNLLGTYRFSGSGNEYVELHSGDGKKISADAMRFSEVGSGSGETMTTVATYFIHSDQIGTPRQISDNRQNVIWRWDSRPFGDSSPDEDPDGNHESFTFNLRFPGQYQDEESGLFYNYFRTYDPSVGRYITSDPVGLRGGLNTYLGVNANPLRFIDPRGLDNVGCTTDPLTIDGRCKRICCAIHDKCYDNNGCTADSWTSDSGCNPEACDNCNKAVVKCFVWCDQGRPLGIEPAPGTPEYYCPAQHRYINIPGDFSTVEAAKAVCGS